MSFTIKQLSKEQRTCSKLSSAARTKIARKKWTLDAEGNIVNGEKKYVVPKRHLHKILSEAHSSTCHHGRDKTERYLQMSYNGISQQVVNLFTLVCKLHQQQSSITSHCKKTISIPIQASGFLCRVEMDLIDFRKLPCNCSKDHNWVLHVEDHFSRYLWLLPLKHKETSEVASSLESLFWMFGFPANLTRNSRNSKVK